MKGQKELDLNDIIDISFNKELNLTSVHPFKNTKTPNVKWLGKMRQMNRKAERYNIY
jgi:hypothetical protein